MAKTAPDKDLLSYQNGGPDLAAACQRLAAGRLAEGEFAAALLFAKKAKGLGCESADNDLNIAESLGALDKSEEAARLCRDVLQETPDNRRAHMLLGWMLMGCKDFKAAAASFQAALELGVEDGEILVDLGIALEADGDETRAGKHFDRAKIDYPDLFETLMDKADRLFSRHLNKAARQGLRKAEKVALKDARAYYEMGLANFIMGFAREAEKLFLASLGLRPTLEAYRELSGLYEKSNNLNKAESFARGALQNAPQEPSLNLVMAHCERRKGDQEAALVRYRKILEVTESDSIRIEALNQIGRILDTKGEVDEAYENFAAAKELLKLDESFATIDIKAQHQKIRAMTAMDWSGKPHSPPPMEVGFAPKQLVFFIGFPRSGTTLIQEILSGHPKVVVTAEERILRKVVDMMLEFEGGYMASLAALTPDLIRDLRALYIYQANTFASFDETTTLVDKLPLNLMQLPLILTLFPEAKIIFALRHPKASVLSCLMQNFRLNNAMVNITGLDEITTFYALVMGMWEKISGERDIPFYYLRYEDVVRDMEGEIKKLTKFLGLPWAPEMLDYAKSARAKGMINTPSYHQVVQPVYTESVEKWRAYEKYFEPYNDRLEPFCEFFGYSG
ncbi:MAG: sulfotransferase [Proteobacteria bacterium]|nr:sulfotransferase [Pseudomonadota bacterium]MCH8322591.1 sulfotransferase [Pseudomonadota bacterium]